MAESGYSIELGGKDLLFFLDGQLLLLFGRIMSRSQLEETMKVRGRIVPSVCSADSGSLENA